MQKRWGSDWILLNKCKLELPLCWDVCGHHLSKVWGGRGKHHNSNGVCWIHTRPSWGPFWNMWCKVPQFPSVRAQGQLPFQMPLSTRQSCLHSGQEPWAQMQRLSHIPLFSQGLAPSRSDVYWKYKCMSPASEPQSPKHVHVSWGINSVLSLVCSCSGNWMKSEPASHLLRGLYSGGPVVILSW